MDHSVPDRVSYQMLLECICTRSISGRTEEELIYMVQLAEELSKLMRDVMEKTRH